MRNMKKLLGFIVVLMVVMTSLCSVGFAANEKYLIVDVFDHYDNNCSAIHELELFDTDNNKISYTISSTHAYDTARISIPYYWNRGANFWDKTGLNDGSHLYGQVTSALVHHDSLPDSGKWARFVLIFDSSKTISKINVWAGQTRVPKKVTIYQSSSYDYTTNIKGRDNANLALLGSCDIVNTASVIAYPINVNTAPTNLTAVADSCKVTLSWTSVEGATSYNIKRGTISGQYDSITPFTPITTESSISFEDTGLTNGTTYYYVVSAITNGIEGPNSIEVSATPMQTIPLPPTNLTAEAGDKFVRLVWNPVENATGYNVKRATTPDGEFQTIALNLPSNSFIDSGLENDTTYYYVVSVIVGGVESPDSNIAPGTPYAEVVIDNNVILQITMLNGAIKEYDLTADEIQDFLIWYDSRSDGIGKAYYTFINKGIVSPFLNKSEFIPFDKILYFEVNEYAAG